jgi:Dirigent-like protein
MDQPTARPPASRPRFARAAAILAAATAVAGTSAFVTTALTPAAAASAAPSATAAAHHHVSVLHFTVRFSPFHPVDVPPLATGPGDFGIGDYVVFSDKLLDAKGREVGIEAGSGLVTALSSTDLQVAYSMTIQLRQGQIAVQGLASNAATKRLGIVGGTGRYVGASGHIDLTENGDSANTGKLVVTLGA